MNLLTNSYRVPQVWMQPIFIWPCFSEVWFIQYGGYWLLRILGLILHLQLQQIQFPYYPTINVRLIEEKKLFIAVNVHVNGRFFFPLWVCGWLAPKINWDRLQLNRHPHEEKWHREWMDINYLGAVKSISSALCWPVRTSFWLVLWRVWWQILCLTNLSKCVINRLQTNAVR